MPSWTIRARPARGDRAALTISTDPNRIASYLEDAAHSPGGYAAEIALPRSEAAFAEALQTAASVLPIGAQSSLTGGATPMGERIVSTAHLNHIELLSPDAARVEPGVTLAALDQVLERSSRYYPPGPTFPGACVGGMVATNAAGAATFKYGTTRDWVKALTVVLPNGDVIDVERGAVRARTEGYFELELSTGSKRLPIPSYRMPRVPKLSAGYFAAPEMDLIDLFIGSEGTLGIVTAVTLRVLPVRPRFCLAMISLADRRQAFELVRQFRLEAHESWQSGDRRGIDISAIEYVDARCLAILREDGADRANGVKLRAGAGSALLVTIELPSATSAAQAFDELGRARDDHPPDTPLARFSAVLSKAGVLDDVEIAVPGDTARAAQLQAVREAVPDGVNRRIGLARRDVDPRIVKAAADMIVPFDRLEEQMDFYEAEFQRRGLDGAVWGHISDGNLHANVLPGSFDDVSRGQAALLEFGRKAIALDGSPLAEHGVGRNAIKQQLLRELYGEAGVEEMRQVKRVIDPEWKMAPGVLFPR